MNKTVLLFVLTFVFGSMQAQDYLLPSRPVVLPQLAPFYHGVASGDPLSDRVIIWTRVTPAFDTARVTWNVDTANSYVDLDTTIVVGWQIATDTTFATIVNSGTVTTDSSRDFTVKVDVTGLQQNTWYYYRFNTGGVNSIIGRTRTTPTGNVDSLRLAFFSCSDFQNGYFNVYHDIAHRNDIDVVAHLGDYYYEYAASATTAGRPHPQSHDAYTLADYRLWQSQYKLDQDLRAIGQQYPWIQIWDDHDVANNDWEDGAQNHNPVTQGDWYTRKHAAFKAYFEWLPIREIAPGNDSILHRSFTWGNLFKLIMMDTRLEARDSSLGQGIPANNSYLTDTNRQMLGRTQLAWVKSELSDTTVQWKIMGNQVMVAPLTALGTILNGDQWDGYPAERRRLFDYIMQQNIHDVVFITGDIHSSWANDLPHPDSSYSSSTGHGSVATEFVGTSVTSSATAFNIPQAIFQLADPWLKYIEFTKRGYVLMDINKHRVQGDFMHMSTVASRNYTVSNDAQWVNLDGNRFLSAATGPIGPRNTNPTFAPFVPDPTTGISATATEKMILISCFPNPSQNEVAIQFYLYQPSKIDLNVYDMMGKAVIHQADQQSQMGLYSTKVYLDGLPFGTYFVTITDGSKVYTQKVVKN
jgi:alkaline phosphatase D